MNQAARCIARALVLALALPAGVALAQIPAEPTAEDQLPAAILGEGAPPAGEPLAYFADDPQTLGYLAVPESEGPHSAVILIHEWNGLVDRVRQTADALAAEGYVALAADLYSGQVGQSREENIALMRETRAAPQTIIANLNAAVEYLNARPGVTGRVATMGWCFGGGIALSYALGGEHHDGTAIFYGRLLDDPEQLQGIHHEVYGTFAQNDRGIPVESVNSFVDALRKAGVENDVHIYDHVEHGFWLHVDRDPETNTEPALHAWQRLKAYLKRVLD